MAAIDVIVSAPRPQLDTWCFPHRRGLRSVHSFTLSQHRAASVELHSIAGKGYCAVLMSLMRNARFACQPSLTEWMQATTAVAERMHRP
jgi:hypothetical protein